MGKGFGLFSCVVVGGGGCCGVGFVVVDFVAVGFIVVIVGCPDGARDIGVVGHWEEQSGGGMKRFVFSRGVCFLPFPLPFPSKV